MAQQRRVLMFQPHGHPTDIPRQLSTACGTGGEPHSPMLSQQSAASGWHTTCVAARPRRMSSAISPPPCRSASATLARSSGASAGSTNATIPAKTPRLLSATCELPSFRVGELVACLAACTSPGGKAAPVELGMHWVTTTSVAAGSGWRSLAGGVPCRWNLAGGCSSSDSSIL